MAATPAPPAAPPKPTWEPRKVEAPFPWLRPTIRIRLTLLYGGMFLIAGILLLSIIYLLAAQALNVGSDLPFRVTGKSSVTSDSCANFRLLPQRPTEAQLNAALNECVNTMRQNALDNLLSRSLLALLGLAVIAFAFGYAMAGRVLSPLGRITRTARRVAGTDLTRRIELDGPDDELKELSDTFDEMLDRLERAFTAQQRFVGNASHELRTPLAINRTLLEVHLSDPGAPPELHQLGKTLLATNERSEQLVEGLLLLARSDNQIVERKPVDLAEVADRAVDQVRGEAEAKGVEIRGERGAAVVQGNGVLLERIALNLVQNAVRYNVPSQEGQGEALQEKGGGGRREGGWVEVTTEAQHGQAVLVVSNTGPVVPAYEIDNLFEPFRRLRTERTGSDKGVGLGLSIARSVARAHGGRIIAEPREGGGLMMRVTLPI
ncbi:MULTISPECIES: sensor histidine kinase [Streptomyces]|uniref:sensor histidine kinase n=1 Tax=Streptomyces TaxID=1883 RepID=UPI001E56BC32|nr:MULTISPECIES: HAMP domain-containing sensor histidine kinase [Streptomyces]UFQ18520.1 HAMP domain-containing histidine kinase [Streptomyces huasconensis]WCL88134.1 HAMP domain-containing sensor histidine kinase [Streptomyces sp. JCM 35825]